MMSHRFTRTIKRAGFLAGIAAAMLLVVDSAGARPRSLALQQAEQEAEPLGPAQDRLIPAQRGGGISLQEASAKAQSAFPGTVVGARQVQMGDRVVYEIRILGQDGRTVRTFRIDAQTGAFL
ncbi:MAG TPA: PepSY domain-containing protein [Gammaproteobacteria bacterium]|nr:PepSY domain-containing protein [Gammaproteobacteria bacterium]